MIAKADIRRVQEWMGHADIQMTMKYLHYAPREEDAQLVTSERFRAGQRARGQPIRARRRDRCVAAASDTQPATTRRANTAISRVINLVLTGRAPGDRRDADAPVLLAAVLGWYEGHIGREDSLRSRRYRRASQATRRRRHPSRPRPRLARKLAEEVNNRCDPEDLNGRLALEAPPGFPRPRPVPERGGIAGPAERSPTPWTGVPLSVHAAMLRARVICVGAPFRISTRQLLAVVARRTAARRAGADVCTHQRSSRSPATNFLRCSRSVTTRLGNPRTSGPTASSRSSRVCSFAQRTSPDRSMKPRFFPSSSRIRISMPLFPT